MAISTMDALVAALGAAQDQKLVLPSVTQAAGGLIHLNQAGVNSFGQLAAPALNTAGGTTYSLSGFSAGGGFPKWTAAAGGQLSYLARAAFTPAGAGTIHVYDIAWACTGFNGTLTTAQSVTGFTGLPSRYSTGAGLEIFALSTTALGATASNLTVQYTNQAGTTGRNTVAAAMISVFPINRMLQCPWQSGDAGVQSVQSVTLSASTGTAGSFGVLLAKRLASITMPIANVATVQNFADLGLPQVDDNACLLLVHQGTTTTTGIILGNLAVVQG